MEAVGIMDGFVMHMFYNEFIYIYLALNRLLCCLLMSFFFFLLVLWLAICVEVDVDRITILTPTPSLPIFFVPSHNPLFNTSDSYLK